MNHEMNERRSVGSSRRWAGLSVLVVALLGVLLVLPSDAADDKSKDGVVATVDGQPILSETVEQSVQSQLGAVEAERVKCELEADRTLPGGKLTLYLEGSLLLDEARHLESCGSPRQGRHTGGIQAEIAHLCLVSRLDRAIDEHQLTVAELQLLDSDRHRS